MRLIVAAAVIASISTAQAAQPIVEADNGQRFQIFDTQRWSNGGAAAIVLPMGGPGDVYPEINMQFDCHGHMFERSVGYTFIAPRSVAARISAIACATPARKS